MADMITLTMQPVRVTPGSNIVQPMYLATDIGGYDFLDLEFGLVGVEGTTPTVISVDLITGMQAQTEDGWVPSSTSPNLYNGATSGFAANTWVKTNFPSGLLRYVRWRVTTLTGGTAITFFIRGMARRYA